MRKMLMIACLLSFAAMCGCNKVPTPEMETEQWRNAAEHGDAKAQYRLGLCYASGNGVTQDKTEAVKWYLKAAEQGDAEALYKLGQCFDNGEGVTKDMTKAVKCYRMAAEWGFEPAEEALKELEQRGGKTP